MSTQKHSHVPKISEFSFVFFPRNIRQKCFITYDASTEESDNKISLSFRISELGDFWLDMLILIGDIVSLASARLIVISGLVGSVAFLPPLSIVPKYDLSVDWWSPGSLGSFG